ncbi:MAG: hypothetical protein HC767_08480 [Akkermansiaceae bacterium]|nr:hypothetical protein [Akkermansiaceae bacterium]
MEPGRDRSSFADHDAGGATGVQLKADMPLRSSVTTRDHPRDVCFCIRSTGRCRRTQGLSTVAVI